MRPAVVAVTAVVLATGCVKATMDFAVKSDGSGSFEVEMSIAQELLQMAAAFQEGDVQNSAEEVCQEILQGEDAEGSPLEGLSFGGAGFDVEQEIVVDDSSCGMRVRAGWPAEQAEQAYLYLGEDGGPTIERVGSQGWSFDMPFDFADEGDPGGFDASFAGLLDFSLVISVTLPGQPVEHNADSASSECDATTFKWDIDITKPSDLLSAEADGKNECEGGSGWGAGPIVAVVILGVVVAALAAAVVMRRSSRRSFDQGSLVPESPEPDSPSPVDDVDRS